MWSKRTQTHFRLVVPRFMKQAYSPRYFTYQPTSEIHHTNTEAEMIRSSCSGAYVLLCQFINVPRGIRCRRLICCTMSILRHGCLWNTQRHTNCLSEYRETWARLAQQRLLFILFLPLLERDDLKSWSLLCSESAQNYVADVSGRKNWDRYVKFCLT